MLARVDAIRSLFATEPAAQERKYTAGNVQPSIRAIAAALLLGHGFEHVEIHFSRTSTCAADCMCRRYRDYVLDIKREGANGLRATIPRSWIGLSREQASSADSLEVAASCAPGRVDSNTSSWDTVLRFRAAKHIVEAGDTWQKPVGRFQHHHRGKLFLFD